MPPQVEGGPQATVVLTRVGCTARSHEGSERRREAKGNTGTGEVEKGFYRRLPVIQFANGQP